MTYLQRALLVISIVLSVLLAALILRSIPRKADTAPVADAQLFFDPASAHRMAETLAVRHPQRGMGTEGSKASAEWIADEMRRLGLRAEMQEFSAWIYGSLTEGQNVIGIDEGIREDTIVLLAHYDIPFHVKEGAMDDASGVGVLLELARVFMNEEQEKTLVYIASDGEEWGMLGARHFVESHPEPDRLFAAVSLDYVRVEDPEKVYVGGEGQFRGYAPFWLWLLTENCIKKVGGEPKIPSPAEHYINQAVDISSTDQGPFVAAGIPAINLGGNKSDSPLARSIYHTQMDTHENLNPELFAIYGQASELLIRSLDIIEQPPASETYFLPLKGRSFAGRTGLFILQMFLFLPLLFATAFHYYNLRERENFLNIVLTEAVNYGLFLLPWLLAVIALHTLVHLNHIPRFELYPATPLDPFLYQPQWGAILIVGAIFVFSWAIIFLMRRWFSFFTEPDFRVSKAVGLDILLTLSLVALILNGFAATLFLAPAALLWIWAEAGRRPGRIALNLALVLAGALALVLLVCYFSASLRLGWHVLWYMLLAVSYKFFSPIAVFIAVAVLTVGGRLVQQSLKAQKHSEKAETEKDELLETRV